MKKLLALTLFATVGLSAIAADRAAPVHHPDAGFMPVTLIDKTVRKDHETDDVYTYDFDGDPDGWTSHGTGREDDTWHVELTGFDTWESEVWWSADAAIGGYRNSHFAWFQTASMDLSGASSTSMTFDLYYSTENPGGEPVGYDSWDGCNVWVSTDGGTDFSVITGTPVYDASSSYAFGHEFGMGTGVPQWCGEYSGWLAASFDLSAYDGEGDVIVRWVMCSDPCAAYYDPECDQAIEEALGMQLDNILIQDTTREVIWSHDGVSNVGGAPSHGFYIYGNEWEHTNDEWLCDDGNSLGGYIQSPDITIPGSYRCEMQYDVWCDMPDSDGDDDDFLEDYFHVEYTIDGGLNWTTLHYDYARAGAGVPGDPDLYNGYWTMVEGDNFNGSLVFITPADSVDVTCNLRVRITTDDDSDGGDGTGLHIDNVILTAEEAPANDLSITKVWVDYPHNEDEFQYPKCEITNWGTTTQDNIRAYWKVWADSVGGTLVRAPQPLNTTAQQVPGLDFVRVEQTAGSPPPWKWMPADPGEYVLQVYVRSEDLEGPDEFPANDTLDFDYYVTEANVGFLRYDYDTSSAWTLSQTDEDGALVRFDPIDQPWTDQFIFTTLYNVDPGDEVHYVIHAEGPDFETPGALLAEYQTTVIDTSDIYPYTMVRYAGNLQELRCISDTLWVGIRGNENNETGIVGLSSDNGGPWWEQHSYRYDYTDDTASAWNGDVRIFLQVDWGVVSELPLEIELTGTMDGTYTTYTLSWTSPGPVDGYLVYRSAEGYDNYVQIADVPASQTTYDDAVPADTKYFYKVVGYNGLCPE